MKKRRASDIANSVIPFLVGFEVAALFGVAVNLRLPQTVALVGFAFICFSSLVAYWYS